MPWLAIATILQYSFWKWNHRNQWEMYFELLIRVSCAAESDPVVYCTTCSELVHKGRMAKHALVCVKPDVSQVSNSVLKVAMISVLFHRLIICYTL